MTKLPVLAGADTQVTGQLLRTLAYAATSGQAGVVTPGGMKVTANGAAVDIAPGAATIPTRYVSSPSFNSYIATATATESLAIPATGSGGGATRYIIARVDDPEYGGQGDPTKTYWRYDQVSSITGLAYPFVPLARINQPASTTTITDAMITDLRVVSTPRRTRDTYDRAPVASMSLTSSTYVDFPQSVFVDCPIPEWASKAVIRVDLLDVIHHDANVDGNLVVQVGSGPDAQAKSAQRRYDKTWGGSSSRHDMTLLATFGIPAASRGTTKRIKVQGNRAGGSGRLHADLNTQVIYDIEFIEEAS